MEENGSMSESNMPKDYKTGGRATNKTINIKDKKALVDSCLESSTGQAKFLDGGDLLGEFPWPPRSYTCTFCKREFRSAQALGGHMNVHRREKARLRQITPPKYLGFLPAHLNLDRNPNPNPNMSTTFALKTASFPSMLRSPSSVQTYSSSLAFSAPRFNKLCPSARANFTAMRSQKSDLTVDGFYDFCHEEESLIVKKPENGSFVDSKFDDLDLELRLGYS
ncbi:hypothetical protein Lser_V15G14010 [Lactuca serriola]